MFCSGFGGYGGFGAASSIGYGGMFLAMGFRMLIFIALIVLAFKLFKNYTNKSNDAMKILNYNLGGGEINKEAYLNRISLSSQKN
jgi:putative membrane protein